MMLVAAIVGGYSARFLRIPRVVGFLAGGVALRALLGELVGANDDRAIADVLENVAKPLAAIKDLALGLILFTIGGVFERSSLRAIGRTALKISLSEITLVLGGVLLAVLVVTKLMGTSGDTGQGLVLALLLATAAVATAPAATLFVLQEYESKGPVTRTILGVTAINNIVCIVLFQVVFLLLASTGTIETRGLIADHLVLALVASTIGSVAIGVVVATMISITYTKLPLGEALLFFFAMFIILGAGEEWLWQHRGVSYNRLLTALVVGAVFANITVDAQKLTTMLRTVAAPVFAGFFVMAGYDLHLEDLAHMGWLGAAYVLARAFGKWGGCKLGIRWAKAPLRAEGRLGPALMCQAAVVIGLASFVDRFWVSESASMFSTIVLGSVVLFEVVGPLCVKRCVVQAGEVKAVTLLRRPESPGENGSGIRSALRNLGRLFGMHADPDTGVPEEMRVDHIMRTNVQTIPASATFTDVLHAIERSTHSHFPVVTDDGTFAGVIHFSDVHDVIYDPTLTNLVTAVDLADADSTTVTIDMTLKDLMGLFSQQDVAVFPVVEEAGGKRIVGLVEQRDLLRALHKSQESP